MIVNEAPVRSSVTRPTEALDGPKTTMTSSEPGFPTATRAVSGAFFAPLAVTRRTSSPSSSNSFGEALVPESSRVTVCGSRSRPNHLVEVWPAKSLIGDRTGPMPAIAGVARPGSVLVTGW